MRLEDVFFLIGFSGISVPCSIQEGIKERKSKWLFSTE